MKEDVSRSQLAVKKQSTIDKLLFYSADRNIGPDGRSVMHSYYKELTNFNSPLGE